MVKPGNNRGHVAALHIEVDGKVYVANTGKRVQVVDEAGMVVGNFRPKSEDDLKEQLKEHLQNCAPTRRSARGHDAKRFKYDGSMENQYGQDILDRWEQMSLAEKSRNFHSTVKYTLFRILEGKSTNRYAWQSDEDGLREAFQEYCLTVLGVAASALTYDKDKKGRAIKNLKGPSTSEFRRAQMRHMGLDPYEPKNFVSLHLDFGRVYLTLYKGVHVMEAHFKGLLDGPDKDGDVWNINMHVAHIERLKSMENGLQWMDKYTSETPLYRRVPSLAIWVSLPRSPAEFRSMDLCEKKTLVDTYVKVVMYVALKGSHEYPCGAGTVEDLEAIRRDFTTHFAEIVALPHLLDAAWSLSGIKGPSQFEEHVAELREQGLSGDDLMVPLEMDTDFVDFASDMKNPARCRVCIGIRGYIEGQDSRIKEPCKYNLNWARSGYDALKRTDSVQAAIDYIENSNAYKRDNRLVFRAERLARG